MRRAFCFAVTETPIDEQHVDRLIDLVQRADAACLLEDDAALAMRLGTDGVHLPADVELYRTAARTARQRARALASAAVLCATTPCSWPSLAPIMSASGLTPQAIIDSIDQCAELIAWWAEIFVVPCVAWNVDTADQAERFASLGADFVAPSKLIWQADDGVDRIAKIASAISRARRAA